MKKITEDGEIIDEVTQEPIAIVSPFWKTPFNHDRDAEARSTALYCEDKSMTKQSFLADADINNILRKFMTTGEPPLTTGAPVYQDFEELYDLQDKMVTAYQVEEAWNALSPEVRNVLKNPATFASYVEHCLEVGDIDPLRALGLAKPKEELQATRSDSAAPPGGTPAPEAGKGAPAPK